MQRHYNTALFVISIFIFIWSLWNLVEWMGGAAAADASARRVTGLPIISDIPVAISVENGSWTGSGMTGGRSCSFTESWREFGGTSRVTKATSESSASFTTEVQTRRRLSISSFSSLSHQSAIRIIPSPLHSSLIRGGTSSVFNASFPILYSSLAGHKKGAVLTRFSRSSPSQSAANPKSSFVKDFGGGNSASLTSSETEKRWSTKSSSPHSNHYQATTITPSSSQSLGAAATPAPTTSTVASTSSCKSAADRCVHDSATISHHSWSIPPPTTASTLLSTTLLTWLPCFVPDGCFNEGNPPLCIVACF